MIQVASLLGGWLISLPQATQVQEVTRWIQQTQQTQVLIGGRLENLVAKLSFNTLIPDIMLVVIIVRTLKN